MRNIAHSLKSLRENSGMTQKEFAQHCEISKSVLAQYEIGLRNPSNRVLYKVCRLFEVSPSYFGLQTINKKTETHIKKDTLRGGKPMDNRLQNHLLDEIESLKQMNTELINQMKTLESQPPPKFSWTESSAEKIALELNADSTFQEIANELHIKSEQWSYLFKNINQPLGISRKGIIREVNQMYVEQFGYDRNEMIGKPIMDFIHPDEHGRLKKVIMSDKSDYVWRVKKKNGHYCRVRVQRQAFGDPDDGFSVSLMECIDENCADID